MVVVQWNGKCQMRVKSCTVLSADVPRNQGAATGEMRGGYLCGLLIPRLLSLWKLCFTIKKVNCCVFYICFFSIHHIYIYLQLLSGFLNCVKVRLDVKTLDNGAYTTV